VVDSSGCIVAHVHECKNYTLTISWKHRLLSLVDMLRDRARGVSQPPFVAEARKLPKLTPLYTPIRRLLT